MIKCNILSYKLIIVGGKVVLLTHCEAYMIKAIFGSSVDDKLSQIIQSRAGVNQEDISIGLKFRKYLADLELSS